MTQIINLTGAASTLILPVTTPTESGAITEIHFYPLNKDSVVGAKVSVEDLKASGVEPSFVIRMDSMKKVNVLHHQVSKAVVLHEAALKELQNKKMEEEYSHIQEMANLLAERQRAFEAKYGLPNRAPNHSVGVDAFSEALKKSMGQTFKVEV